MNEKRIAVVMNGGISLAVWMGGVTHEINRLRLAAGESEPEDELERAVHKAWKAILNHISAKVIVDTIAGTSAGGLNGALLATAIALGSDLTPLKKTWIEQASLEPGKLLRSAPADAASVLDGAFFTDEINDLLTSVANKGSSTTGFDQQEVTLMVTATAIGSSLAPMNLEGGRSDYYSDSRRVFRFRRKLRHDGSEMVNDFHMSSASNERNGVPNGPLARAARASASFPAAFVPVMEDEQLEQFRRPGSAKVGRCPLMDGGVLDNAPFEPLIEALRERPIDAPFDRILLYVVPSARARGITPLGETELPDAGKVLRGVMSTVNEPDQRLDVEALSDAFRQMSYQTTTPHAALAGALGQRPGCASVENLKTAARALFEKLPVRPS